MNAIKGEANIVNRRRGWDSPLDASLFANNVSRADVRRDAGGGRRIAPRLPPLDARQGPAARPRRAACRGGTCSRRCRSRRARSPGTRASTSSAARSRRTARRSAASSTGPSTSSGSTPARATASAAARSACRSSTTARSCCSTGAAASTRRRPPRTSSATPTTTRSWPTARRCSDSCRWRWPRPPASSARRWWSKTACSTSTGTERLALLDVDLLGATRWSSTSTAGSCSRPRCSPAASAARSASRSSTR